MTHRTLDRAVETSTTTSTSTYTLAGAVSGYVSLATAGAADGDTVVYHAEDVDASGVPQGGFEIGLGTVGGSGTTLARTKVYKSSNSNNAVSWSAGTRRIVATIMSRHTNVMTPESQSSGTDITLTANSNALQLVTFTTTSLSVIAPDATTIIPGQAWCIKNIGSNLGSFKNNGGTVLAKLAPGQTIFVICTAIGSANGTWYVHHEDGMRFDYETNSPAAYATVTLTSASNFVQRVVPQGWGCIVKLPDATTFGGAGQLFRVINDSDTYPVQIQNNGSTIVGSVDPSEAVLVYLTDNSTANGVWLVSESTSAITVDVKTFTQKATFDSLVRISDTQFVILERDGSTYPYGRAVSISSDQISIGSSTALSSNQWGGAPYITVMSDGRVILTAPNSGFTSAYAVALSASGTTLTVGTEVTCNSKLGTGPTAVAYSQGVFLYATYDDTGTSGFYQFASQIASVGSSGVTITLGTAQTANFVSGDTSGSYYSAQLDSDTQVTGLLDVTNGSSPYNHNVYGFKIVRSGTSVTLTLTTSGAPSIRTSDQGGGPSQFTWFPLGSGKFLVSYSDTSMYRRHCVLDSAAGSWGTSVTNSKVQDLSTWYPSEVQLSSCYLSAYPSSSPTNTTYLEAMTVSGSTITLGSTFSTGVSPSVLCTPKGVIGNTAVYQPSDTYTIGVSVSGTTISCNVSVYGGLQTSYLTIMGADSSAYYAVTGDSSYTNTVVSFAIASDGTMTTLRTARYTGWIPMNNAALWTFDTTSTSFIVRMSQYISGKMWFSPHGDQRVFTGVGKPTRIPGVPYATRAAAVTNYSKSAGTGKLLAYGGSNYDANTLYLMKAA